LVKIRNVDMLKSKFTITAMLQKSYTYIVAYCICKGNKKLFDKTLCMEIKKSFPLQNCISVFQKTIHTPDANVFTITFKHRLS